MLVRALVLRGAKFWTSSHQKGPSPIQFLGKKNTRMANRLYEGKRCDAISPQRPLHPPPSQLILLQADDPPGCEICFEPWSQVTRRGALACGHDRFCTGCVADYFQTAFAQEKGGKRATYRCPLGCTLRSNKVLNLR